MQAIVNDVTKAMTNTINRVNPRMRALVLAVLIVLLAATPITLGAANNHTNTNAGKAAAVATATRGARTSTTPVAGLTQTQMDHAATIVATADQMGLPEQAAVVGVATAMQETNLRNLANTGLPESLGQPNDGTGFDHDSVGLFQQRPASGWGPVDQLMDPPTSARKFYQALEEVPGWQDMPVTVAAQTVQGSAFPDAYAKHQDKAEAVVDTLTK